ncbi:hypothetical protein V1503_19245 [Bacillus sp. SCS-151]|uniref:hypothetical protein n=1 Tax=Nanhaiella sioensis TaxID=3115293 RepID=UPI00397B90F2
MNQIENVLNASSVPRLQIRCEHEEGDYIFQTWKYELVYEHFTGEIAKIMMGETKRESGSGEKPIGEDGLLELPYRDGAHIKHDAIMFNMPAYAICDDTVQKIDLGKFKDKFPEKY